MNNLCEYCDGAGRRDILSGALCFFCHGMGFTPDSDDEPFDDRDDEEYQERENERRAEMFNGRSRGL